MSTSTPAVPTAVQGFDRVRAGVRRGTWIEGLGVLALLLVAYAVPTLLVDRALRLEWIFRFLLFASFAVVWLRQLARRLLRPLAIRLDDDEVALAIERQSPQTQQALISSVQFERLLGRGSRTVESVSMMEAVIADVRGRLGGMSVRDTVDRARVGKFAAGLALALLFFGGWAVLSAGSLRVWALRNVFLTSTEWPRYTRLEFAELNAAGGTRIPQGDALTIRVRVTGGPVPDQMFLDYEYGTGKDNYRGGDKGSDPMSRTGDREFSLTIDAVLQNVTLRAEGGDGLTDDVRVTVVERPRLEGMRIQLAFPDYMHKEPEAVPPTEGEIRLPRGGTVLIEGRSHKPIDDAFLLFEGDRKLPLAKQADGHAFSGKLTPETSGLLVVDVIDQDRLGAAAPPKLMLRLVDDRPPSLDFKLRGIGALISNQARIPGDLKVKDDFGITDVAAAVRVVADAPDSGPKPNTGPADAPKPADVPFEKADVTYGDLLRKGTVRYETPASVDLIQFSPDQDQNSEKNKIRPGMLLSLRFAAKDNFGPGDPHQSFGEVLTFRVVTREKLLEELRRRQVEQRQELTRIQEEERTCQFEVKEMLNPTAENDKAKQARARLKALARQQQALGRRVAFVGESYQKILLEFENNRLIEPAKVREIESLICTPLATLAKEPFPATSRQIDDFSSSGKEDVRSSAVAGCEEILRKIETILKVMATAESLAALIEELRGVIKIEDGAIKDVEKRLLDAAKELLDPGKQPEKPKEPEKPGEPKKK